MLTTLKKLFFPQFRTPRNYYCRKDTIMSNIISTEIFDSRNEPGGPKIVSNSRF